MFRRILYFSAFLSAFCLLATLILWPLSYHRNWIVEYGTSGGNVYRIVIMDGRVLPEYWSLATFPSGIRFQSTQSNSDDSFAKWSYLTWKTSSATPEVIVTSLGIGWIQFTPLPPTRVTIVAIPCFYTACLFAFLPTMMARRALRRTREF